MVTSVSVLIPTFRRPNDLDRCLGALEDQERAPDEIVVVWRTDDTLTTPIIEKWRARIPLKIVRIPPPPSQVAALNKGISECNCEVIAITDDDGSPHVDWLLNITSIFDKLPKSFVGVGGPDRLCGHLMPTKKNRKNVGKMLWYGRIVHGHDAVSEYVDGRSVDYLRGVNCAYRANVLKEVGFNSELRGNGAEWGNDMMLGFSIIKRGYKLWFDTRVIVDHYHGARFYDDQRNLFNSSWTENAALNTWLCIKMYPNIFKKTNAVAWNIVIGNKHTPGIALAIYLALLREDSNAIPRFKASMLGAYRAFFNRRYEK